jgi:hypothetical protein
MLNVIMLSVLASIEDILMICTQLFYSGLVVIFKNKIIMYKIVQFHYMNIRLHFQYSNLSSNCLYNIGILILTKDTIGCININIGAYFACDYLITWFYIINTTNNFVGNLTIV